MVQYYNAPRMTLTIFGSQSLDKLQRWAENLFSQVPSVSYPRQELEPWIGTPPFLPPAFREAYKVVPVQDERQLSLMWTIPFKVGKGFDRLECFGSTDGLIVESILLLSG